MKYISTRGIAPAIVSKKAIIKGIAEDGGLYVPESFPSLGANPFNDVIEEPYAARAVKVLESFLTDYAPTELSRACNHAYANNFDSPLTAPVRFLEGGTAVLRTRLRRNQALIQRKAPTRIKALMISPGSSISTLPLF